MSGLPRLTVESFKKVHHVNFVEYVKKFDHVGSVIKVNHVQSVKKVGQVESVKKVDAVHCPVC